MHILLLGRLGSPTATAVTSACSSAPENGIAGLSNSVCCVRASQSLAVSLGHSLGKALLQPVMCWAVASQPGADPCVSAPQDGSPELSDVEDPGSARRLLQERRVTRAGGSPACATPLKRETDEGDSEQETPAK